MKAWMNFQLTPEERAEQLLDVMGWEEKLAQLGCAFPRDLPDAAEAEQFPLGIGSVSVLEMRMLETPEACSRFQRAFQQQMMANQPHHIPAIFHMEGLCGPLFQDTTSFPAGIGRGSSFDPELEKQIGSIVARQELACGITHALAPVLDIARDPRLGRQGESYGEDPTLAAAMGSAYASGIQETRVDGRNADAVAKHFLGFHQSAGGIHGAHTAVTSREMREIFAKPFQAAITEAGLKGVMPCYCSIDGIPLHTNRELLTDLLRGEMGFEGLTVADYSAVSNVYRAQHVAESLEDAGKQALEAGLDVETPSQECFTPALLADEKHRQLVDQAVRRVLVAKFRMGLFEHPFALQGLELKEHLHGEKDARLTLQSARESLVLLKNDGALSLKKNVHRIVLIGCHWSNARFLFGGYTHLSMAEAVQAAGASMAGVAPKPWQNGEYTPYPGTPIQPDTGKCFDEILRRQKPDMRSLLEEFRYQLPDAEVQYAYGYPVAGTDESHYEEALRIAAEADVILLSLGGKYGSGSIASMGEGVDGSQIGLPPCQEHLMQKLAKLGKPMIGIHLNGRPISSDVADQCLNAILECWSPSEGGAQAIVETLLGKNNPSGKLPVTVARHEGQLPLYYNHPWGSMWTQGESIGFQNYVDLPHTPRYPFGFGLSYTSFAYEDMQVNRSRFEPTDTMRISLTIQNTGAVAGTEIVQLYVRDGHASVTRPNMEMVGFARVNLQPGEAKRVTFRVRLSQLAFLDRSMRWKVEKGTMKLMLGTSSADIRLDKTVEILSDAWVDGKNRGFYAKTQVE